MTARPRFFVAIDLPEAIRIALQAIQPPSLPELRLAPVSQMHLTLHFLGEAEFKPVVTALSSLSATQFELSVEGVGQFPSAGRGTICWAGLCQSPELMRLHSTIATVLAPSGFLPESRLYQPHITLARCNSSVSPSVVEKFLHEHRAFQSPCFLVEHLILYSSTLRPEGPIYREELRIALSP